MGVIKNPKYAYLFGRQPFYFKALKILFYYYSKAVFTFYSPLKVYGKSNIPNESFIFCSNHNSHMDVAILAVSVDKDFNHFGMLAARDYWFDNWIRRTSINLVMNLIPIERYNKGSERELTIKDTESMCDAFMNYNSRNLIIFPEGTRGAPGRVNPFKRGAARFSLNLRKPILPAVIYGSHKVWPKGKFFFSLPTNISIYILKPVYPDNFIKSENPSDEELAVATNKINDTIEKMIKDKADEIYGQ